jgi:AraC-like DNA-binding protein
VQIEHEHPTLIPQIIGMHHELHGYSIEDLATMTGLYAAEYAERFDDHPTGGLRVVR